MGERCQSGRRDCHRQRLADCSDGQATGNLGCAQIDDNFFESRLFLSNFEIHFINKTFLTFFLKLFLLSVELDLIS